MESREQWRAVVGYEGLYEVSDQGRVRNAVTGHLKSQQSGPYPWVALFRGDGKMRPGKVHRLMASAFLPPPLPGQIDVCHNNGDPSDNRLVNLRWDTHAANMADIRTHGTGRNQHTAKTHCKRNHELAAENLHIDPRGARVCRACRRLRQLRSAA